MQILVLGAHPDDAEYHMGGTMALYRTAGHAVKAVSVTDGGAGHFNEFSSRNFLSQHFHQFLSYIY